MTYLGWLQRRALPLIAAGMGGVTTTFGWQFVGVGLFLVAAVAQELLISQEVRR